MTHDKELSELTLTLKKHVEELQRTRALHFTKKSWAKHSAAIEAALLAEFQRMVKNERFLQIMREREQPVCVVMPNLSGDLKNIKTFTDMMNFVRMLKIDALPDLLADLILIILKIYPKPKAASAPGDTASAQGFGMQMLDEPLDDEYYAPAP